MTMPRQNMPSLVTARNKWAFSTFDN